MKTTQGNRPNGKNVRAGKPQPRLVDQNALRFNQAMIISLLVLAFLFDQSWLVAFVAAVMLVGTVWPGLGLFKNLYAKVLVPNGLLRPAPQPDEPQPHLFAQGLGGLMLLIATLAFAVGAATVGWVLAGIVVVLASANLFLGFCAGCFIYFQLGRRGIRPDLPLWREA
jgi:hypothetical protein